MGRREPAAHLLEDRDCALRRHHPFASDEVREVLAFDEPPDYLPKKGWLAQLLGRPLDDELRLKRGVRPITGASLSSKAATDAVRRVLALHHAIP